MEADILRDKLQKEMNEHEGTIIFKIRLENLGNLFDSAIENNIIFDHRIGNSRFALFRSKNLDFVFEHWSTKIGRRIAKINVKEINFELGLFVAVTWSRSEITLFIGNNKDKLITQSAKDIYGKVRLGKDGQLYQIGGNGIDVGHYSIRVEGKSVLSPTAKEIWDFTVMKVKALQEITSENFLQETIIVQQCLVMLVTGFEVYTRERFHELDAMAGDSDPNLWIRFVLWVRQIFSNTNSKVINFQKADDCKRAYIKYGIKFEKIAELHPKIWEKVRKYILWRHKIIHSSQDMTILNFEEVSSKEPLFANKIFIKEALNDFIEFIDKLHTQTINSLSIEIGQSTR